MHETIRETFDQWNMSEMTDPCSATFSYLISYLTHGKLKASFNDKYRTKYIYIYI